MFLINLGQDVENIILDYKKQMELLEHKKKFRKTLDIIENMYVFNSQTIEDKYFFLIISLFFNIIFFVSLIRYSIILFIVYFLPLILILILILIIETYKLIRIIINY